MYLSINLWRYSFLFAFYGISLSVQGAAVSCIRRWSAWTWFVMMLCAGSVCACVSLGNAFLLIGTAASSRLTGMSAALCLGGGIPRIGINIFIAVEHFGGQRRYFTGGTFGAGLLFGKIYIVQQKTPHIFTSYIITYLIRRNNTFFSFCNKF